MDTEINFISDENSEPFIRRTSLTPICLRRDAVGRVATPVPPE